MKGRLFPGDAAGVSSGPAEKASRRSTIGRRVELHDEMLEVLAGPGGKVVVLLENGR